MPNDTTSNTTKPTDICRRKGCELLAVSGPYHTQDNCDQHSCHVCHQAPAVVQFMNEQGFCSACSKSAVRGTELYPVVRFE